MPLVAALTALSAAAPVGGDTGKAALLGDQLSPLLARLPHSKALAAACVIDPATGKTVFEFRADEPMTPASAAKLFVMAASLDVLGPEYTFETTFGVRGDDVFVIGGGDPGFGDPRLCAARGEEVTTVFARWAAALRQRGLATIPGRLVLDDFVFEDPGVHPTWDVRDLGNWYAAPVGGLCLNDNCIEITLRPTAPGDAPTWSVVPPAPRAVQLVNECRTGKGAGPVLHTSLTAPHYRVTGAIQKTHAFESVACPQPTVLFGDAMRAALQREGVTIRGDVVRAPVRRADGSLPPDAVILAVHRTSLPDVLGRIGRHSQNLFAECTLKQVGREGRRRRGEPTPRGDWTGGSAEVTQALSRAGLDVAGLSMADGSGLSRQNRCTARQLAAALAWMQRHPAGAVFRDSLAQPGQEGSLRSAMKELAGRIRAKTGTMQGIRSLAGYVTSDSGRAYAFAIIFNNYPGGSAPYKDLQTRFCKTLADRLP